MSKILYVNGDSHSAGAEIVNDFCFAEDDTNYHDWGRGPHPENIPFSYGYLLNRDLKLKLKLDAESASSNDRIIRTTNKYLTHHREYIRAIVIGWATWEREEFYWNKTYYQFTAGMYPDPNWPKEVQEHYRDWVLTADSNSHKEYWHEEIYKLHCMLEQLNIPHLFFNTFAHFAGLKEYNWDNCYINPYDPNETYYHHLIGQGFKPKNNGYHFGAGAHEYWANYLKPKIESKLV